MHFRHKAPNLFRGVQQWRIDAAKAIVNFRTDRETSGSSTWPRRTQSKQAKSATDRKNRPLEVRTSMTIET